MGPDSQSNGHCMAGVLNRGILVAVMRILSLVKEGSGSARRIRQQWSLISKPKVRGYRKRMLWLNEADKGMFWVSEQRLVYQANTIRRNSWLTDLEIEELERNFADNDSYKEEERSADDTGRNLGEKVRNILTALEADEEIGNLQEEEIAIIEKIIEVLERTQEDKLPALRDIPKKKL